MNSKGADQTFKISTTRNIQCVFKKLVYLTVFVKDIFDIYLNNIYHIDYAWFVNVKVSIDCMRCLATKNAKIPIIFKYTRIVLPLKQNCAYVSVKIV